MRNASTIKFRKIKTTPVTSQWHQLMSRIPLTEPEL
uniref:Uncharacterized protein n=1 Tax=Anguilla anguilla TaxID=7936 RepID=A0A0E9S530_ANGAN